MDSVMTRVCIIAALVGALIVVGCASNSPLLEKKELTAIQAAMNQAKTDINCPQLTPALLSKKMVLDSVPRPQYTISVTGCGTSALYTVTCPELGYDIYDCAITRSPVTP
jgi:hypothetical protein